MTYTFECNSCAKVAEVQMSISEYTGEYKCETCGSDDTARLIEGGAGFQLKGGGWYSDGYSTTSTGSKDRARAKEMLS